MTHGNMTHDSIVMIRPATPADRSAISDCVQAAFEPYIPRIGKPPGPMLDDYETVIKTHQVSVAIVNNSIVGVLVLIQTSQGILLDNMAVHPSSQGMGLGKALMAHAEQAAKRQGYPKIQLYTHEKMVENIAMYRKRGYFEIKWCVEKGYQRIYMEKQLS